MLRGKFKLKAVLASLTASLNFLSNQAKEKVKEHKKWRETKKKKYQVLQLKQDSLILCKHPLQIDIFLLLITNANNNIFKSYNKIKNWLISLFKMTKKNLKL